MIKILLIDDKIDSVKNIVNNVKDYNQAEFLITHISTNANDAYEYITIRNPDVILLNLQIEDFDVLELFELLKKFDASNEIIIITEEDNNLLNTIVKNYNITRVFLKPFNLKILNECLSNINKEKIEELKKQNLYNSLDEILSKFNFNRNSIGYSYIIDIFKICFKYGSVPTPFESNVYLKLAKLNNLNKSENIKWNVEKSINSMKNSTNKEIIEYYFEDLKVTPKTFIHVIFDFIMLKRNQIS